MAVIRYIADLHFGDENIIAYDNRPFLSVSEMNEALIERWNRVVGKDDLTWILGDFCVGSAEDWAGILDRLNGRKALIVGNHDSREAIEKLRDRFEDIADYRGFRTSGITTSAGCICTGMFTPGLRQTSWSIPNCSCASCMCGTTSALHTTSVRCSRTWIILRVRWRKSLLLKHECYDLLKFFRI